VASLTGVFQLGLAAAAIAYRSTSAAPGERASR
jgi:hypothetical protein